MAANGCQFNQNVFPFEQQQKQMKCFIVFFAETNAKKKTERLQTESHSFNVDMTFSMYQYFTFMTVKTEWKFTQALSI